MMYLCVLITLVADNCCYGSMKRKRAEDIVDAIFGPPDSEPLVWSLDRPGAADVVDKVLSAPEAAEVLRRSFSAEFYESARLIGLLSDWDYFSHRQQIFKRIDSLVGIPFKDGGFRFRREIGDFGEMLGRLPEWPLQDIILPAHQGFLPGLLLMNTIANGFIKELLETRDIALVENAKYFINGVMQMMGIFGRSMASGRPLPLIDITSSLLHLMQRFVRKGDVTRHMSFLSYKPGRSPRGVYNPIIGQFHQLLVLSQNPPRVILAAYPALVTELVELRGSVSDMVEYSVRLDRFVQVLSFTRL
jgi:hypothetical protein